MVKFLTNIMAQLNESKKDNKGFTLVELIIVVAIIAVLATVLAPQYLQYVERSRESNDIQVAQNLMDAATVAIADPSTNVPSDSTVTIVWDSNFDTSAGTATVTAGGFSVNNATTGDLYDSIEAVVGSVLGKGESADGAATDLTFTITVSTGEIDKTASSAEWEALLD